MNQEKAKIFVWKDGRFTQLNDIILFLAGIYHDLNRGCAIASGDTLYQLARKRKGPVIPPVMTKTFDSSFDDTFK